MRLVCIYTIVFFAFLGVVIGSENYVDYEHENVENNTPNLRELYRFLVQRSLYGGRTPMEIDSPYEHLMIRKSQRSPSLRLRFGRSDPSMSQGNPFMKAGSNAAFEDN